MPSKETIPLADLLRVEGVNCHGYGAIPKYAMLDRDLTITAKGIYAYFCAMSGSGSTAFPSRDTIQSHLSLGSDAYYKHRQLLIDHGYLLVSAQRRRGKEFAQNLYTLVSNPKKFEQSESQSEWQSKVYSVIHHQGLKAAGFGLIPRAVMQDSRLDIKAKAVYAYFASYAGNGHSAFPEVAKILKDLGVTKNTYLKAMKALQEVNYIEVKQRNWSSGKRGFSVNDYYLIEKPLSQLKNPDMIKPDTIKPHMIKSDTEKPYIKKSDPMNSDIKEPNIKKPDTTNHKITIHNVFTKNNPSGKDCPPVVDSPRIDRSDQNENTSFEEALKEAVDFDFLPMMQRKLDTASIENLIKIMVAACSTPNDTIRIGGDDVPKEHAKEVFLSLTLDHLEYVLDCVSKKQGPIRNIRAYYLAALYHAPETFDIYYNNLIREDEEAPGGGI